MICRRCKAEVPDGSFCLACGAKQEIRRAPKKRGNGQGCVYKRGSTWTAKIEQNVGGKRIVRTKGGFRTKREAYEYIPTLKSPKPKVSNEITFKALYDRWLPFYTPRVGESTMNGHKAAFAYFKALHYEPFIEICTDDLQDCVNECPKGKRTKENMKSLAVALYNYAAANRINTANFGKYIYCGNDAEGTWPPLSADELETVRKAMSKGIPYADYVYVFCYTGFRPNELLRLTRDAYDSAHETLTGGFKTEAGKDRVITLSPKIKGIVKRYAEAAAPYIFPRENNMLMQGDYFRDNVFAPLMDELGIKGKVPYSCRHTFANLMKNVQGADKDKAALMGHADISMTKYYQSADYESLKRITDSL